MRISPMVVLIVAMLGCGSGTQPTKPPAESGGNQDQKQKAAVFESPISKTPDAAAVKKNLTPAQLALGDPVVNSIGMLLVPIAAGEFQMGSLDLDFDAEDNEKPRHLVKITKPFYLSAYEITQQQYEKVMGVRPWQGKITVKEGPDYPATFMPWNEALNFCRKLSEQEGAEYFLPTEAQWEYACRAGTVTAYSFGDDVSKLGQHAWYRANTFGVGEKYAHLVGQKLPNPWGLYDMHGNVWEWCRDWNGPYGSEKSLTDPTGPKQGEGRVSRGGAFFLRPSLVRSAIRPFYPADIRFNFFYGFRPARVYR